MFLVGDRAPFLKSLAELYRTQEFIDDIKCLISPEELRITPSLTPDSLYECLRLKSRTSAFRGAQEDAQEFLTYLMDELHEEFLANRKGLSWQIRGSKDSFALSEVSQSESESTSSLTGISTGGEWSEVGGRKVIALSRTMDHQESPISYLFYGKYKSILRKVGHKDSITLEPFHCISLPIQDDSVTDLNGAFEALVAPESIEGGMSKRILLEKMPPVLIIQLKRFVYDPREGVVKLNKFVSFPDHLQFPPSSFSAPTISSYRLFSVCLHHGRTASGGHYTNHIRRTLHNSPGEQQPLWYSFDDAYVALEASDAVFKESHAWQNAYLLFYIKHS